MKEYYDYLGYDPDNERLKFRHKKHMHKKDKLKQRHSKSWNQKYGDDIGYDERDCKTKYY